MPRISLFAFAMLVGLAGLLPAKDRAHPNPSVRPRPLAEQPAWMRQPKDANLPETASRQARLVVAYCGQCHAAPPPALRTGAEWRWMIVQMDTRMMATQRAGLRTVTNEELSEIAHYYGRLAEP